MYCVIRFCEIRDENVLNWLRDSLQRDVPGIYGGPDIRVPDRVSCSVADQTEWDDLTAEIDVKVRELKATIRAAPQHGIRMELDTAIFCGTDMPWISDYSLNCELMSLFVDLQLEFTITLYHNCGFSGGAESSPTAQPDSEPKPERD